MKRNREYIPYLRNLVGHKEIRATGVTALIINEKEEVLLEKRSDNSLFSLPGGALDRDETIYEGRLREIKEETGLIVKNGILFQIISEKILPKQFAQAEVIITMPAGIL